MKASNVFPILMPKATAGGAPVKILVKKAAPKIAGHNSYPNNNKAERDIPVGNQMRVANPPTALILRPIIAVKK